MSEAIFPRDGETAALLRESTAYADKKNWAAALECLENVKARMIVSPVHFPIEAWCKLALYLSRAGRFDDAMKEFDWLLADLPRRARRESFMDDPSVSFGRTSKESIYAGIVENGKRVIEHKRQVALRRMKNESRK